VTGAETRKPYERDRNKVESSRFVRGALGVLSAKF
jgi:hypothetical protein